MSTASQVVMWLFIVVPAYFVIGLLLAVWSRVPLALVAWPVYIIIFLYACLYRYLWQPFKKLLHAIGFR